MMAVLSWGGCPVHHGNEVEVGVPFVLLLSSLGQHLHKGFDPPLTLAITLGAEGGFGLSVFDAQEMADYLEKSGLKLGALVL